MTGPTLITSLGGLGRVTFGGWIAAALGVPAAWALHWIGGFPTLVVATVLVAAATEWALRRGGAALVADRLVGQMMALWALSGGLWIAGAAPHLFPWPGWLGGFVVCQFLTLAVFRRVPGVWNDLAAGAAASAIVLAAAAISHGWIG